MKSFFRNRNSNVFFDSDIYFVTSIDENASIIKTSKTKYLCLIYAKKTNKWIVK